MSFVTVTRPFFESRVNWVIDPAPPASHRPVTEASPAPTSAILVPSSGAPSQLPRRQKSRRRRRRKAARSANHNSASRQAERSANDNSARRRATQPRSTANDLPGMKSTPVEHPHSFTSSLLTQPPISAANQNSGIASRQDHCEIWGLYKPAQTDPRQDLTASHSRVNISGFGLSSPALQQPSTKHFSGLPSRRLMTSPHREAWDCLSAAAPCRPPRHAADDRRCPARSCRPRPSIQATHGVGYHGIQAEGGFPSTRTTPAPVPQTPPQSLNGGLQVIQALSSTRPLV